jgi:hypothetical protein
MQWIHIWNSFGQPNSVLEENKRRLGPRKTTVEEQVMISVSQEFLNGLTREKVLLNGTIDELRRHIRALEAENRELVSAVNELD